ncbi:abortive infection protein [Streptomyces sp. NPDC093149]|uniref:abortive infection protein n=1 Tax=Streptomyces sp. NPDC093149 TaxID=3366031 RepID=UPI0037F8C3C1
MRDDATGLVWKGINYDTGTNYAESGLSRKPVSSGLIRQHMAVIQNDLNCTSVNLFGTDIGRLTETAGTALDLGLHVSLQPRVIEAEPDAMLEHLAATAMAAEELRERYGRVTLNVGCELTVFGCGIIPGGSHADRSAKLADPQWWPRFPEFNERLNDLLGRARDVARAHFGGHLTYGAGLWEEVDWDGFDMVGLNYYRMAYNDADYATNLRRFHQHGKPIVITEFGCCSFDGAAEMGPAGYGIIDWTADPPRLAGSFTRNEQVQADYLSQQLELFAAERVFGAYVFEFIAPKPHSRDPRYDLDMASFGVVRTIGDGWEPKAAFHELARFYSSH